MAIQTPWGSDGQSYSGADMRQLVAAMTGGATGVVGAADFAPSASGTPNANVNFAAGRAILPSDDGACYEVANTSSGAAVELNPTSSNPRKDRILLEVDSSGDGVLTVVQGTPGSSPSEPSLSGHTRFLELAMVTIPASTSAITSGMITDRRPRLLSGAQSSLIVPGTLSAYGPPGTNSSPGGAVGSVTVGPYPVATTVELVGLRDISMGAPGMARGGWFTSGSSQIGPAVMTTYAPAASGSVTLHATAVVSLPANTTSTYYLRAWTQAIATIQTYNDSTYSRLYARVSA